MRGNLETVTRALRRPITPEDAARASLVSAVIAVVAVGLGSWLALSQGNTQLGLWALAAGLVMWVVTWWISASLAVVAIRQASAASRPKDVRRQAVFALAIDVTLTFAMGSVLWLSLSR